MSCFRFSKCIVSFGHVNISMTCKEAVCGYFGMVSFISKVANSSFRTDETKCQMRVLVT